MPILPSKPTRYWGIIPASGIGSRFNHTIPKQYLTLNGKPIIDYSIELLRQVPNIVDIIVAISTEDAHWKSESQYSQTVKIAYGGTERIHSVYNALKLLEDVADAQDWIIIHDAVRPLASRQDLLKLIDETQEHNIGGLLGSPMANTIKYVTEQYCVDHTIDRTRVWHAYTPQIFRYQILQKALGLAIAKKNLATDESGAIEAMGLTPKMIHGRSSNIKITQPDDLKLAQFFLTKETALPSPLIEEKSSEPTKVPKHVAIIMDGNGRWAQANNMHRIKGHRAGFKCVKKIIEHAINRDIKALTLFAFSSENWQRPAIEVEKLMQLFMFALNHETQQLHKNNVQLKFIGQTDSFDKNLQNKIHKAELLTAHNTGLKLRIAANYGGRWDIVNAAQKAHIALKENKLNIESLTPEIFTQFLSLHDLPPPDLFIRTGNEQRISNFLLWQLAYTELYFSDKMWPDFTTDEFDQAIVDFSKRNRRFGKTKEQIYAEA